jgi:hypothetical protein
VKISTADCAVRQARDFTPSDLATKTDIAELRGEIVQAEPRLIKWVIGVGIAAALAVGGLIWTAPATAVPPRATTSRPFRFRHAIWRLSRRPASAFPDSAARPISTT